jgi:hypothetical protein
VNWPIYNKSLVRRGEFLLGFDVIENWETDLKEMNQGKIGLEIIPYLILFSFFYLVMPRHTFIFLTDKPKRE